MFYEEINRNMVVTCIQLKNRFRAHLCVLHIHKIETVLIKSQFTRVG
jgi:hypothetical protein